MLIINKIFGKLPCTIIVALFFLPLLSTEASTEGFQKLRDLFPIPNKPKAVEGKYWERYGGEGKQPYSIRELSDSQIKKSQAGSFSFYTQLAVIYHIEKGENKSLAKKYFISSARSLLDEDFSKSGTTYLIGRTGIIRTTLYMSGALKEAGLYENLVDKLLMRGKFLDVKDPILNMDWARDRIPACWELVAYIDSSKAKINLLKKLQYATSKVLEKLFTSDGGAIHHNCDHISYASYSTVPIARLVLNIQKTEFQLSSEAIDNLKAFARARAMSCIGLYSPGNLSARATLSGFYFKELPMLLLILHELDQVNGEPGTEMMDLFLSLEGRHESWKQGWYDKGYTKKALSGHISLNVSSAAIHRRDSWVVSIDGNRSPFKGIEMYVNPGTPRSFMKNSSRGSIQIFKRETIQQQFGYKLSGWDHNHYPGVTTNTALLYDLMTTNNTSQVRNGSTFAQGTSLGNNGMWAMIVKDKEELCRKSVYCFDNRITVITSNIKTNKLVPAHTTIFQSSLQRKNDPIYLARKKIVEFPLSYKRSLLESVLLQDNMNNEYFIHSSRAGSLFLSRNTQKSYDFNKVKENAPGKLRKKPKSVSREAAKSYLEYCIPQIGDFTKAYVEHTDANSSFIYTIYVDSRMGSKQPYKILKLDKSFHVFHDIPNNIYCYTLFEKGIENPVGFINSSNRPLTAMVKPEGENIHCSFSSSSYENDRYLQGKAKSISPNNHLSVTLNGLYELAEDANNVQLKYERGKTLLDIQFNKNMSIQFKIKEKN